MPAQAAVSSARSAITPASASQPANDQSFYQQQRDKLKYTPESTLLSPDFSRLRKRNEPIRIEQHEYELGEVETTKPSSDCTANKKQTKQQNKQSPAILSTFPKLNWSNKREDTFNPDGAIELDDKANREPYISQHRDPRVILETARKKHSPLQGRDLNVRLNVKTFSPDTLNIRKPGLASLKQLPEKISQIKNELHSNIQQQPEQLKRILTTTKTDLQQRSAAQISGPLDRVKTFIQRSVKDPLSHLLRKVGIAAQETADQLQ